MRSTADADGHERPMNEGQNPTPDTATVASRDKQGTRHALIVGINEYEDPQVRNLEFARADAQAMYDILTDPQLGRFKPDNVTLLIDGEATGQRILEVLMYDLRGAVKPEDTVLIYFAGHGSPAPGFGGGESADGLEKFIVPVDANIGRIAVSGINMQKVKECFAFLGAWQVICLLDCCYSGMSGGRTIANPKYKTRASLTDEFLDDIAGEGLLVMTACDVNEVSIESQDDEHGLFTHYLIEGLGGAADTDGDGAVGLIELYDYVHREVSRHARELGGKMTPILKGALRGTTPVTDYETPDLKKARALNAKAGEACDAGELDRADELWNQVLALFRHFPEAHAGRERVEAKRKELRESRARMRHIFISYARDDRSKAARVADILEAEGWQVWWDRSILGGDTWRQEIGEALKEAGCVLVLWSDPSINSKFVLDEASRAQRREILLPIRIEDVELPVGFGEEQTEELLDGGADPNQPGVQRMIEAIDRIQSRSGPRPAGEQEIAGGKRPTTAIEEALTVGGGAVPLEAPMLPELNPWERVYDPTSEPVPTPDPLPAVPDVLPVPSREPWIGPAWLSRLTRAARPALSSRSGLMGLLGIFFLVNWGETTLEESSSVPDLPWEMDFTIAFHWLEGYFDFQFHDLTNQVAVVGYTTSYFFLFPVLLLYPAIVLGRRPSADGFRLYSFGIVLDYLFTLPFYVLVPVQERWFYPEAGAMMLSDKISAQLIEFIRPMSGLDNCFPSSHTSLTVVAILMCFVFKLPLRLTALALGSTVILSTFVLGIHWGADVLAGLAMGVLAVAAAIRLEGYVRRVWALPEPDAV